MNKVVLALSGLILLIGCVVSQKEKENPITPQPISPPNEEWRRIRVMVDCTILGTSPATFLKNDLTYVVDEHGHRGTVRGIWGDKGDKIRATCFDGLIH